MQFEVIASGEKCSAARNVFNTQRLIVSSEATLKWQTPSHLLWRWRSA